MDGIREAQAEGDREKADGLLKQMRGDDVRRMEEAHVVGELEGKLASEGWDGRRVVWPGKDEGGMRRDDKCGVREGGGGDGEEAVS